MNNTTTRLAKLIFIIFLIHYADSYNLRYSIQSNAIGGDECMTDCDEKGLCWVTYSTQQRCNPGFKKAPTYFTSRYRYPSTSECHSKCVYDSKSYSWCYIDDDANWDYCSTETDGFGSWYEYTNSNGRCKNACAKATGLVLKTSYYWCYTYWSSPRWDFCDEDIYYYEERSNTVYGKKCFGNCKQHDNTYYWCYDEDGRKEICALSDLPHVCRTPKQRSKRSALLEDDKINDNKTLSRVRRARPPRRTVAEYNQDINILTTHHPNIHTVTLSHPNQPNSDNPILDYTYRDYNGIRLPLRVRAIIHPFHVNTKPRKGKGISSGARKNCEAMGLNRCVPNNNNDHCGHIIPYVLSGPADWYNIVPQTQRINIGTREGSDLEAPSVWAIMERSMRRIVRRGGYVEFNVVIAYDLPCTRPTGFGVTERFFHANGTLDFECMNYWYSNDPFNDPDEWNSG